MKKPYYLHWFTADPFNRLVVLVVGDYKASFKKLDRTFRDKSSPPKDRKLFSDGIAKVLEKSPPTGDLKQCGRTIHKDLDIFMWFPVFPTPGTLAHELEHAKDYILTSAGVADNNGETDAYLIGQMYDHFFFRVGEGQSPGETQMTVVDIAWASISAILQIIVIGFAYTIGLHNGYWKRVDEEKFARRIR